MQKPAAAWEEDDVLALPPGETDGFERKGARLLDLTISGVNQDDVFNELAKQLSAFANTGGGQIIYGVTDGGAVDNGGVARTVKGRQSTEEWLEDVIPTLTDYEIVGFNVYEIAPKTSRSAIDANKSLYVVDVPDSERAPHQSKRDCKYYVRLASKSQPASHRLLEDIRNRVRHPRVEVYDPRILDATYVADPNQSRDSLRITLEVGVRNIGRILAAHTALLFAGSTPLSLSLGGGDEHYVRSSAKPGTGLIELRSPLFPEMEIRVRLSFAMQALVLRPTSAHRKGLLEIGDTNMNDATLAITSFADSAPPRQQEFKFSEIDPDFQLITVIQSEQRRRNYPAP
jgi:hypothetical protein